MFVLTLRDRPGIKVKHGNNDQINNVCEIIPSSAKCIAVNI